MFGKWTGKEVARFLICFVCFFVLILLTQLPGFVSPLYWAMFPVLSAFVAVGPLTCVMDMKRGFGSTAVLPLLWFVVYRLMGEISMPLMWVWIIAILVLGEILRKIIGYDTLKSIRICVPVMSLVPFANLIPLYFTKQAFLTRAAEEMETSYVAGLDRHGTLWMFVIVFLMAIAAAVVSERISERILKIQA